MQVVAGKFVGSTGVGTWGAQAHLDADVADTSRGERRIGYSVVWAGQAAGSVRVLICTAIICATVGAERAVSSATAAQRACLAVIWFEGVEDDVIVFNKISCRADVAVCCRLRVLDRAVGIWRAVARPTDQVASNRGPSNVHVAKCAGVAVADGRCACGRRRQLGNARACRA